jgi:sugar transferase (PEP-CTERM/EpsH1 system associated)
LENGLVNLINRSPPARYRHAIICLTGADTFADRIRAPGVEVIELHKRPGHDPAVYWRLWRTLRRLRPAIVHTRNTAALETQVLGLLMPRTRRVHGEHGRDVHDLDGSNRRYRWLRRALAPLINRFITVSRDLEAWLVKDVGIPAGRVVQIYNGVDHARFAVRRQPAGETAAPATLTHAVPGLPGGFLPGSRGLVFGTVGRLAEVKDQWIIIRALSRIFEARPALRDALRCIVVGEGPERRRLTEAIAAYGLDKNVWLAGDRTDVPALLAAMDVFLLPSLGEGISNTILEAMASGLPVIATNVGGNPELVSEGETGVLVPAGDESALAAAMLGLYDQPDQRQRMGIAAQREVRQRFDWERAVEQYLGVYDALLGRNDGPTFTAVAR